jgi:hypothetical protein
MLNSQSERLNWQPSISKISLAPHQQAAIKKCFDVESNYNNIILRDPPGSGKTYTILGYLRASKENVFINDNFNTSNLLSSIPAVITDIPTDILDTNVNDIIIENKSSSLINKISEYNYLMNNDINILKTTEIELDSILQNSNNTINNNFINLKLNETENIKSRISNTNNIIQNLQDISSKFNNSTSIQNIRKRNITNRQTTLIVIPYNIYTQWIGAIERIGGLTYYSYCNFSEITSLYFSYSSILFNYDIILTVPLYYEIIASISKDVGFVFDRVIIDEVDSLSYDIQITFGATHTITKSNLVKRCDSILANKRWYVSASLTNLVVYQNNYGIYFPNYFGKSQIGIEYKLSSKELKQIYSEINIFTDKQFIDSSFILPSPQIRNYIIYNKIIDNILNNILNKSQIEALNADDYEALNLKYNVSISSNLQDIIKIVAKELVEDIELWEKQLNVLNDAILKMEEEQELDASNLNQEDQPKNTCLNELNMKQTIEKRNEKKELLSSKKAKYSMLIERIKSNDMCLVCYEDIKHNNVSSVIMKCCQNSFCITCIFSLLNVNNGLSNCPMCRTAFKISDISILNKTIEVINVNNQTQKENIFNIGDYKLSSNEYSKQKLLFEITKFILETPHQPAKIMIFTNGWETVFNGLKKQFPLTNIDLLWNLNNVEQIDKQVKNFKVGNTTILISTPSTYGCGMNFENATDLILMHNVHNIEQVIGRCQRFGRTKPLNIWKIFNENEN